MGKDQEFLEAARNGNLAMFEKILNQKSKRGGPLASLRRGPGINVQDSVGYSALHYSALNGHTDIVRLLLFHDASPNIRDSRGSSALHLAAWAGHQEIVKMLLTHPYKPANPDMQTMENETPLHCAAQHGHTGALTTLLAHGADPSVRNSRHETPLDLAAQYGRLQAVQMLIRAHPELLQAYSVETSSNSIGASHSALHLASRNGHNNVVEILLAAGVNVNYRTTSGTALHEAALCGKDLVVRTLLEAGADLNHTDSEGRTPLDVLQEFPPHVTKSIISVIQGFRRKGNVNERRCLNEAVRPSLTFHSFEQDYPEPLPQEDHHKQNNFIHISPSVSTHSFEHESGSSHVSVLNEEFYVKMEPAKTQKAAPKKPPRRNLSISPTHLQNFILSNEPFRKSIEFCDSSVTEAYIPSISENSKKTEAELYEYICSASSGSATYSNNENIIDTTPSKTHSWFAEMAESACLKPVPVARKKNSLPSNENAIYKSYNPNRKLRRNREHYFTKGQFTLAISSSNQNILGSQNTTNSTPTRDDKTCPKRPLSQEYKYPPGNLLLGGEIATCQQDKHPTSLSLCNSSGSISSGVSLSDRSLSTDCVEEYVCDEPFAGLFKGSTANLNGGSSKTPTTYHISSDHINLPALQCRNFSREKSTKISTDSQSESSDDEVSNGNKKSLPKNLKKEKRLSSESKCKPLEPQNRKTRLFSSPHYSCDNNQHVQHTTNFKSKSDSTKESSSSVSPIENKPLTSSRTSKILSSFNEQEAWNKLSQIMETFGNSSINGLNSYSDSDEIYQTEDHMKLAMLLEQNGLRHLERTLYLNGYDNFKFVNGIFDEKDLAIMNVVGEDAQKLLKFVATLPCANFTPLAIESSLNHWLSTINLIEYNDNFKKHLYNTLKSVCGVWEIELQTVLEINKIGHRKRILHSVANIRQTAEVSKSSETDATDKVPRGTLRSNKKTRPAPKPPIKSLEIRAPSELLIGLPSKLHMKWPHSASALVSNSLKYEVCYLGSTVVKELRGTESTRKSIQKLKRVGQCSSLQQTINDTKLALVQLSISHRGVEFIDVKSNGTICEHEIRNINCACQDADDMRFFAYITKDNELNLHYCHVFNVDNMHLAMEIILTLAESFEVAYQMALRTTPTTTRKKEKC